MAVVARLLPPAATVAMSLQLKEEAKDKELDCTEKNDGLAPLSVMAACLKAKNEIWAAAFGNFFGF
ncbi:hypothetical protein C1H46_007857 [Malus baccata]|uniref:Uncharacterized protein n=1 Tax=Malus baccata TaxID=106549 RepID=A0A540N6E0_MALBA|nr:hypothetical protein C1H46_007857 [Malus baccata]